MKQILLFLLFLGSISVFAQTPQAKSYVITQKGTVTDVAAYEQAMETGNWDKYRYFDKRSVLRFETGLVVELLSANEMKALGLPVKTDRVRTKDPDFDTGSVFRLTTSGIIVEMMTRTKIK